MHNMRLFFGTNFGKITAIVISIIIAGILYGLSTNKQMSTQNHTDPHTELQDDASVVTLSNHTNPFTDSNIAELEGRIMNNIYENHYKQTRILERQAEIVEGITKKSASDFHFRVKFLPSNTEYGVVIVVQDFVEKNFTINIESGDKK